MDAFVYDFAQPVHTFGPGEVTIIASIRWRQHRYALLTGLTRPGGEVRQHRRTWARSRDGARRKHAMPASGCGSGLKTAPGICRTVRKYATCARRLPADESGNAFLTDEQARHLPCTAQAGTRGRHMELEVRQSLTFGLHRPAPGPSSRPCGSDHLPHAASMGHEQLCQQPRQRRATEASSYSPIRSSTKMRPLAHHDQFDRFVADEILSLLTADLPGEHLLLSASCRFYSSPDSSSRRSRRAVLSLQQRTLRRDQARTRASKRGPAGHVSKMAPSACGRRPLPRYGRCAGQRRPCRGRGDGKRLESKPLPETNDVFICDLHDPSSTIRRTFAAAPCCLVNPMGRTCYAA